jgi:vacuolar-type H+-ATPase subunit H
MPTKNPRHELDEAAQQAVKVIADASSVAAKKIADAAEEAHKVVADAAATSVKVLHLKSADDHDLLIELKTRMEGLKDDIKDIKDGTTKRIADLEQNKADRLDLEQLEKEVHGKREDRLRKLENISSKNWIYLTLYSLLTGGLATLLITHLIK